jgi:hypothetical protein
MRTRICRTWRWLWRGQAKEVVQGTYSQGNPQSSTLIAICRSQLYPLITNPFRIYTLCSLLPMERNSHLRGMAVVLIIRHSSLWLAKIFSLKTKQTLEIASSMYHSKTLDTLTNNSISHTNSINGRNRSLIS